MRSALEAAGSDAMVRRTLRRQSASIGWAGVRFQVLCPRGRPRTGT